LNRYDGYNFKVFKHDPERPESLGGVYIYSLFKDRAGTIWVGTDQSLDRFDPLTEKFSHYHFDVPDSSGLPTTVNQISQDSSGMLWLSTRKGLFRLDPVTGKTKHFYHDPGDPSSLFRLDPVTGKTKHFYHDPGDPSSLGITISSPPVRTEPADFGSAPARLSTNLIGTREK